MKRGFGSRPRRAVATLLPRERFQQRIPLVRWQRLDVARRVTNSGGVVFRPGARHFDAGSREITFVSLGQRLCE